jgi:hypothetical protein
LDVKKIGGGPQLEGPVSTQSGEPRKGVQAPFADKLPGSSDAAGSGDPLQRALLGAVESVRAGGFTGDEAIEAVLDAARASIGPTLPDEVDIEDVLEYIRETLENDPTFLALVEG